MTRHIEIRLPRNGVRALARLLDDEAPRTCQAVWDQLPVAPDAFHGKYARNEVYGLVPGFPNPGPEHTTITPIPGDVVAFWFSDDDLGAASHGYAPGQKPADTGHGIVDLAFFYGRNNLLLNPDSGWVPGNVFATIVEGLPELAAAAQDLWLRGVEGERLELRRSER